MDPSLRNTHELTSRLNRMQAELIRRFGNIVEQAAVRKTDRSVTVVAQYKIKTETAALIRAAEDVQTLIRQLQEMWLCGQLDVLGEKERGEREESARVVRELLEKVLEMQGDVKE